MIVLSLAEIAAVTGGTLADAPDPHACVTGPAVSDSRQAAPGGLFAAIGGARVDGHDFAAQAFTAGAACVLASRPVGGPAVIVPDVTAALGQLARHILARIKDVTVIALTGSAGKTTTKDILGQCCAACSGPATSSSSRHPARSAWRTSRRHSKRMVRPARPANRRRPMASRSAQGAADRLSADAKVCRPVDHIG
jgi:Mur ligase family, catalytic domain